MPCCVCRRPLTRSASAAASIGPTCLRRLNGAKQRRPAKREADERQVDWLEVRACQP
jgi:hypothetical protein